LIVEEDRSTLGLISDTFEMMDFEVARALEYKRICRERLIMGRGILWGGIISISAWAVLGMVVANLLGY